jgi:Uma2 family endonuclease
MNAPAVPKIRMNVPEFLAWAEQQPRGRFELIAGEVVAMAPERLRHVHVKLEVAVALREAIRTANVPCMVFTDGASVVIHDHKTCEPDASVACGVAIDPDSMILKQPLIVVEVVSPTSVRQDSGAKVTDYFSVASIAHYLLIYPEERKVVHLWRKEDSIESRTHHDGELALDPPGITMPVAALLGSHFPGTAEVRS